MSAPVARTFENQTVNAQITAAKNLLIEALASAPEQVSEFLLKALPCAPSLVDNPRIYVRTLPDEDGDEVCHITGLGLINSLLAAMTGQRLYAMIDVNLKTGAEKVLGFSTTSE